MNSISTSTPAAFSKKTGWLILAALIFLDAGVTFALGAEGNPLWRYFTQRFGIWVVLVLAVLLLAVLYGAIKLLAPLVAMTDRLVNSEEVLLTNLVIIYALYDCYFLLLVFQAAFVRPLFESPALLIAALLVPGLIPYNVYLSYKQKQIAAKRE